MLNKVFFIFLVLLLTGCVTTGTTKSSSVQENQVAAVPLTKKTDLKSVQLSLKAKGFEPGPIDGDMGPKTRHAIRQFQEKEGYFVDGLATTRLLEQLKPGYVSSNKEPYDDSIAGESTVKAAAVGAAIGGALAMITGDKDEKGKNAAKGAAIGAVLGAGTDVAVNVHRVNKAESEHQLKISIDELRLENERLKQDIDDAKSVIKEDRAKIKQIEKQLKQKTLTKKQAQKEYSQLDKNREFLQTTYNDLVKKQKERQQQAETQGATKDITDEINRMSDEVASLKTQLDELDQLRSISITG